MQKMKLYIQQRVFAIGDKFEIYSEAGNVAFYVEGFNFLGHQRTVYDANDNEVGYIQQKLMRLTPSFEVYLSGRGLLGQVSKKITLFFNDYNVDYNDWYISGDLFGWNYEIADNNRSIASISKKIVSFGDCYEIDIPNAGDVEEVIMLVLAIDAANEGK